MAEGREKPGGKVLHCSFCGKNQHEVKKLIAGPDVWICDECTELCYDIIRDDVTHPPASGRAKIETPKNIKAMLDLHVIGQENAKKILALAVYAHYRRREASQKQAEGSPRVEKSNILLVGPTGSGKTLLAQTIATALKVPFAICDATSYTEAGYVGADVEDMIAKLLQSSNQDVKSAEWGIIYIDEADKIARKAESAHTKDPSGEGVQQAILKMVEGKVVAVPPLGGRRVQGQEITQVDTTNILFILGGAFDGVLPIIEKRSTTATGIGFTGKVYSPDDQSAKDLLLRSLQPDDLVKYGMIPELVGRIPVLAVLDALDAVALARVLTAPQNALMKQYKHLFLTEGTELLWEEDAIEEIAKRAIRKKTGARGLKSILEELFREYLYELPSLREANTAPPKFLLTKGDVERGIIPPPVPFVKLEIGNTPETPEGNRKK